MEHVGVSPGVQQLSKLLHRAVGDCLDREGQLEVEGSALVPGHTMFGSHVTWTLRSDFTQSVGNQLGDNTGLAGGEVFPILEPDIIKHFFT